MGTVPGMTRIKVAVLDDYQRVAATLARWDQIDGEVEFFDDHIPDRERLVERLEPFHVIVAMRERTPFPASLLDGLSNLKLLVTTGMRNAAIDVEAAHRLGVVVCGTESPPHSTAELTFALILALARGLFDEVASVRAGGWQHGLGSDVRGATLGLIGLGRQGSQVAQFGQVFGMTAIAWSQNLTDERAGEVRVRRVGFERLLESSDFVSIHLRLSDRTHGLIDRSQLARMKSSAYLVNTSRGPIVETQALLEAVKSGAIAGAAIDVYDSEPLPADHPIRREPRILATPHIGYVTRETYEVFFTQAVEDVVAWQAGQPIRAL